MGEAISRRELIRRLRLCGFDGPYSGGRHQYLQKGALKIHIPNPHQEDVGPGLLGKILQQAGIDRETWERAEG